MYARVWLGYEKAMKGLVPLALHEGHDACAGGSLNVCESTEIRNIHTIIAYRLDYGSVVSRDRKLRLCAGLHAQVINEGLALPNNLSWIGCRDHAEPQRRGRVFLGLRTAGQKRQEYGNNRK
jgi:hypothetical protein